MSTEPTHLLTLTHATHERPGALLRTVLVCDLIESTALIERLGDRTAADVMGRHDRLARGLMHRHDGREIDKTDGFLMLFERPVQAVAFALEYQRELRALAKETRQPLSARVGIHVGELMTWANTPADVARGAKVVEVEGLAKPIAARLMSVALPGQILLSGVAHTLARRGERELGSQSGSVRWLAHGLYHFKGSSEPLPVYEVGDSEAAPMRHPPDSPKARRTKALWRRPLAVAFAGLALLVAGAAPLYLSLRSVPALGFSERDWVVVGDVVNLTDKTLDTPLTSAFRIGMEQSRYINVLPDVQVRQTLERMQRDRATPIDRDVASEIALREQARAAIVPSVTRYGGKLRLSAEIVDPHRGRTVLVQTADANGADDALLAMDRLLRSLRSDLGESLAQIQSTTQPLERVSTPNLDALRAYSRAYQLAREGDFEQAESVLIHATQLDPQFAAAYAFMGSVLYAQERGPEARAALEQALSIEGRLTERTRIYSRAILANFTDPRAALDLWRMHANLFPDYSTGQHNVGNVCYMFLHDYACAEGGFRKAALVNNPLPNYTLDTLGDVLVAEDKLDEAAEQYRAAHAMSPASGLFGLASALTAAGKLDEAAQYLDNASRQPAHREVEREMRRATLQIARGQIDAATSTLAKATLDAAPLRSPNPRWRAQAAMIAIHISQGDKQAARQLAVRHLAELSSRTVKSDSNFGAIEQLLHGAALAARLGLVREARDALGLAHRVGELDRFPVRGQLATLAQAELDLNAGDAAGVAGRLQAIKGGLELWELHELRARAFRALADIASEAGELRWLTAHRGLAQTQWTDQWLGQQARELALRDAESRLSAHGRRVDAVARSRLRLVAYQLRMH